MAQLDAGGQAAAPAAQQSLHDVPERGAGPVAVVQITDLQFGHGATVLAANLQPPPSIGSQGLGQQGLGVMIIRHGGGIAEREQKGNMGGEPCIRIASLAFFRSVGCWSLQ